MAALLPARLPAAGRFAGGRLPTEAFPGHGGVLLANRSQLLPRRLVFREEPRSAAWALKAVGSGDPEEGEDHDCDLVRKFKTAIRMGKLLPADAEILDPPAASVQKVFGDIAERSFALWVKVTNRLNPSPDTKIYQGLYECGDVFAAGVIRKEAMSWKRGCDLVEGLEVLSRVVSSALHAPLPLTLTLPLDAKLTVEYNCEWGIFMLVRRTYRQVDSDIKNMLN